MGASDPCGLDTSVVLRLLTGVPAEQAGRALQFVVAAFSAGRPSTVSDLVVTEAYFALHHHFGVPKREAVQALSGLFENGMIVPEDGGVSLVVLRQMSAESQKPGLVDRIIHAQYIHQKKRLATFEKASAKMTRTVVL
jgi:hypothetical protein